MIFVVLFVSAFVAANAQGPVPIRDYRINPYYDETPKPYAFSYSAPLDDGVGQSSRSESADASGRVQGSYTLNNDEGHFRVVEYVADEAGFRASVRTNEPGTKSENPADVVMQSEAVPLPYVPVVRRPYLNAAVVDPVVPLAPAAVAPVLEPVEVPENALPPVRRPVYRRPGAYVPRPAVYTARNLYNRPLNRYAYAGK